MWQKIIKKKEKETQNGDIFKIFHFVINIESVYYVWEPTLKRMFGEIIWKNIKEYFNFLLEVFPKNICYKIWS